MRNGALRERQVKKLLERDGWWVARAAGSLGDADLVALKAGETPQLLEIKANEGSPWMHFGRERRVNLKAAALRAGAVAVLVHWPARKQPTFLAQDTWPT